MDEKILQGAFEAFSRYGVRRTTMADIAEQTGISRQSLYSHFDSKDDILRASIRTSIAKTLATIKEDWKSADSLSNRLDIYFKHGVIAYFEMLKNLPDSNDIVTGYNEAGREELNIANQEKERVLQSVLKPYQPEINSKGLSVEQLARFVQTTTSHLKTHAVDAQDLESRLAVLKVAVLQICDERVKSQPAI